MIWSFVLNLSIALLWLLSAVSDYSDYTYRWQLKWYRWDRFKDFLSTELGKRFLRRYSNFGRPFIVIIILFIPLASILIFKLVVLILFFVDLILNIRRLLRGSFRRPEVSMKACLIISVSLLIESFLIYFSQDWDMVLFALILRLGILSIVVLTTNFATDKLKKFYFYLAEQKLKKYPNLVVIGITGSYGKTSTKEFLAQILSKKFNIVKTPKNVNSDIGITRFILKTNFENVRAFIVEIGAYNRGDVQLVCDIVHPTIGILTAINEQHLSLFGSLKNIQETKYELLRSLPKDGIAIVNSDNDYSRELIGELSCQVQTFGTDELYNPTLLIKDVHKTETGIQGSGILRMGNNFIERTYQAPIRGEFNAMNIAPCIMIASHLGMTADERIKAVGELVQPENGLHSYTYGGTTVLDDSYNSNPEGFRAALQLIGSYPSTRKRVVITRGMLELGERSEELHEKIGGEIAFVADELVVYTPDHVEEFRRGIGKYQTNIIPMLEPHEIVTYLKSLKNTDAVILLENRMPKDVRDELVKP